MKLKPCHAPAYKHGAYMRNPKLYGVWSTMMHRCYDDKRVKYPDYGGRGIKVCKEWHDPNVFIDWAETGDWLACYFDTGDSRCADGSLHG